MNHVLSRPLSARTPTSSRSSRALRARALRPAKVQARRAPRVCAGIDVSKEEEEVENEIAEEIPTSNTGKLDGRAFRRSLSSSGRYTRRVSNNEDAASVMATDGVGYSKDGFVAEMRNNGFTMQQDEVTVVLAESYGFCWGVERAVQMAYEAREQHPDKKMHITNEIIHNPKVNKKLEEMGVNFIKDGEFGSEKDFSAVETGDVVIFPAFGASLGEMKEMDDKETVIVDTTCPWVSKVWNAVDMYSKKEFTSLIHGKYAHEEAIATKSFADTYLVVKNLDEAEYVADYILNGGNKEEFLEKFKNAISVGFDPEKDLENIGVANQTTMLRSETEEIGKLFEKTMMKRYGVENLGEHFKVLDTICDATQERQDAMFDLVKKDIDVMLVVGGHNSSNTQHLQEIAEHAGLKSYWIDRATAIQPGNVITYKMADMSDHTTKDWLPAGPITVGVTSGASTPDSVVEDALEAIFATSIDLRTLGAVTPPL